MNKLSKIFFLGFAIVIVLILIFFISIFLYFQFTIDENFIRDVFVEKSENKAAHNDLEKSAEHAESNSLSGDVEELLNRSNKIYIPSSDSYLTYSYSFPAEHLLISKDNEIYSLNESSRYEVAYDVFYSRTAKEVPAQSEFDIKLVDYNEFVGEAVSEEHYSPELTLLRHYSATQCGMIDSGEVVEIAEREIFKGKAEFECPMPCLEKDCEPIQISLIGYVKNLDNGFYAVSVVSGEDDLESSLNVIFGSMTNSEALD